MRPAGRDKPLSAKEISRGVEEVTGQKISESAIAYYLTGERQPSLQTGALLAQFFGVPMSYFTDEDVSKVDADLARLQILRELKRSNVFKVAARLGELSDADLEVLSAVIDRMRPDDNR
jgi:transcriptional regulator with XRE-family HTH domain